MRELGDMAQALLAGKNLDECTEIDDPLDRSMVDLADLRLLDDGKDKPLGLLAGCVVLSVDCDASIVWHPQAR